MPRGEGAKGGEVSSGVTQFVVWGWGVEGVLRRWEGVRVLVCGTLGGLQLGAEHLPQTCPSVKVYCIACYLPVMPLQQ